MRSLKSILITVLLLTTVSASMGYFIWYKSKFKPNENNVANAPHAANSDRIGYNKIRTSAISLRSILDRSYNRNICFIVDMSIPSGKKRFFVYNLQEDSIILSGLVTHGDGSEKVSGVMRFSNDLNSGCTSLGKYKIGNSYYGKFGLAFKLHGVDKSNSHAYNRFVVLHAHPCVPNGEVAPLHICKSLGCPTVSPEFLQKLKEYIKASKKPVVLEIIN